MFLEMQVFVVVGFYLFFVYAVGYDIEVFLEEWIFFIDIEGSFIMSVLF